MATKVCRDCHEEKSLDEFGTVGGKQAHLKRSYCKSCSYKRTKKYNQTPEGREKAREQCRRWGQRNTAHKVQKVRERRQHLGNRTPSWLTSEDRQKIEEYYWLCKDLRAVTGEEYHVDHIVPLCGKSISGLHVPWNLQVLPSDLNLSKSNKWS